MKMDIEHVTEIPTVNRMKSQNVSDMVTSYSVFEHIDTRRNDVIVDNPSQQSKTRSKSSAKRILQ